MDHADHVALIRAGVDPTAGGRWADLGAGDGAFTLALAELLGPAADLLAVDRDSGALARLEPRIRVRFPSAAIATVAADFTRPLPLALAELDGVVAANSLHFVRDPGPVLRAIRDLLRPGGRLVVVEYDVDRGNPWVPHPFSYRRWEGMAAAAGFTDTHQVGRVPSRFLGAIYAAASARPAAGGPG